MNFNDIVDFHQKFHVKSRLVPSPLDHDLFQFRYKFLLEELHEFKEAHDKRDLVKMADSLVDLVYVAMGTAYLMGLPWEPIWDTIHQANMKKIRADHQNPSKRGYQAYDIVKPMGWEPPEPSIRYILNQWGAGI